MEGLMNWQANIKILGVFCGTHPWLYFSNELGVVGWREVVGQPNPETNILAAAVAAQYAAQKVRLLISNDGKIYAIQTI
jgi:hypothetical protein